MDEEDPLANMAFSDASSDEAEDKDSKQARRTGQTEEAWKAIQKDYRTKIEDGNVCLALLPNEHSPVIS